MSEELGWLDALVKTPDEINLVNDKSPEKEVVPSPYGRKLAFTVKDWELLKLIAGFAELGEHRPSNSALGSVLGLGNGAVSARIKRLAQMGLIEVVHFNATDTGANNARELFVVAVPPCPWSPQ